MIENKFNIENYNRKSFIKKAGSLVGVAAFGPSVFSNVNEKIVEKDSLVTQLYKSLNEEQIEKICYPIGDKLQSFTGNWWYVSGKNRLNNTLNEDQTDLVKAIMNTLHSEEFQKPVFRQILRANRRGGFGTASLGFFGKPGDDNFELVVSAHHVSRRCFGNSDKGTGFGGPVFYGHFEKGFHENKDHTGNVYWYQALLINKVFQSFDGKQREKALLLNDHPRSEKSYRPFEFKANKHQGISTKDMTKDQKSLLIKTMRDMLRFFRKGDVDESMKLIEKDIDNIHLAFYGGFKYDVGSDKVWDVWSIESPNLVWYFRGQPHIHCYLNIKRPTVKA
jgi:hypothetical protein